MKTPAASLLSTRRSDVVHAVALGSLLALITLGLVWELWLAPFHPGGSWLVLKIVPLLFAMRGVLRRHVYTMQWSSMLILLYFAEGVVRAASDQGRSAWLGGIETILVLIYFSATLAYLRPYKIAAKKAKQELKKT